MKALVYIESQKIRIVTGSLDGVRVARFEMEIEDAETVLRQAQDERKQKVSNGNTPFVLSLSKHERGTHPQMI